MRIKGSEYLHPIMGSVASDDATALREALKTANETIKRLTKELEDVRRQGMGSGAGLFGLRASEPNASELEDQAPARVQGRISRLPMD